MKFLFLLLFLISSFAEAQDVLGICSQQSIVPEELQFLMKGSAPIVSEINECKEDHNLKDEYIKKVDEPNKGWPNALLDNPLLCLQAMFDGLKDSVEDLLSSIWDLAKAFSKTVNATFWGTYDFLKAAFTGNLSYWYAEASNNASDFLNKLVNSIKAIPNAVVDFVKDKSDDWDCRNDKGQVEMACRIAGYLGTDTLAAVMTLGLNKVAIANKLKKMTSKILPNKKKKSPGDARKKGSELGKLKGGLLDDIIPLNKRNSRMVVEVDSRGHYTVRNFDEAGNPKAFDGSPF